MWDLGCEIWDVRSGMWDLGCEMGDGGSGIWGAASLIRHYMTSPLKGGQFDIHFHCRDGENAEYEKQKSRLCA